MFMLRALLFMTLMLSMLDTVWADEASNADAMARKLQDPLANISALMTDNDILFKTGKGDDEVSYSFQVQPVHAWSFDEQGFNFIARGVIPILGVAPTAVVPPPVDTPVTDTSHVWGLSDIVTQFFFSPKTEDPWKWGLGPMISWKTRTDTDIGGAGWGAGPIGVIVGNITQEISSAFLLGHMWGDEGTFSTTTFQPMIYYNIPSLPGMSISYNATTSYNWDAKGSGNRLTLPLGLGVGKTTAMGGGYGLDMGLGFYVNVVRPDGAADWKINWMFSVLFP